MIIFPAIDIKGAGASIGAGRAEDETVYGTDPVKMASEWKNRGPIPPCSRLTGPLKVFLPMRI